MPSRPWRSRRRWIRATWRSCRPQAPAFARFWPQTRASTSRASWKAPSRLIAWFETFEGAIEQRKADGHVIDNRLVAIEQALITAASADRDVAVVTVRFEADIAAGTRNSDGEVIAGSLSDAVQTRDLWTFRRQMGSRDPNWLLIETDEEA